MMRYVALVAALVALAGWLVQEGAFYQTGNNWFEACWTKMNANRKPATPQESVAWNQCELKIDRTLYEAGYIFVRFSGETPASRAIGAACPSVSNFPPMDLDYFVVREVEHLGGPLLSDRFFSAERMIRRVFAVRWPNCPAVREANGYPKLVMRGGAWEFESKCVPCEEEAELQRRTRMPKEQREERIRELSERKFPMILTIDELREMYQLIDQREEFGPNEPKTWMFPRHGG